MLESKLSDVGIFHNPYRIHAGEKKKNNINVPYLKNKNLSMKCLYIPYILSVCMYAQACTYEHTHTQAHVDLSTLK